MRKITKLLINEVLNIESGVYLSANDFFEKPLDEIHQIRSRLDKAIRGILPTLYVCPICRQGVRIRGGMSQEGESKRRSFHFAHVSDNSFCPIKTNYHLSNSDVDRIKYNGVKESLLHIELKNKIAECLSLNEAYIGDFQDISVEKVVKSANLGREWRKPDIQAFFREKKVVFELQISTTWLGVITQRQEFYKTNEIYIVWLFDRFDMQDDTRELTYNDVIYTNFQNAFVFDYEAYQKSISENDFFLKVFFNTYYIDGRRMRDRWEYRMIRFTDLNLDPS